MRTRRVESAPTLRARSSRDWSPRNLQHIASKCARCGSRITHALCVVAAPLNRTRSRASVCAAEKVVAKTPRHTLQKKHGKRQQPRFCSDARELAQHECVAHGRNVQQSLANNAHNHTNPPRCSGLSVSGVVFVGFSFQPLPRADGAMRNKAARRQCPYACIRNALTTTGTDTMRNTF